MGLSCVSVGRPWPQWDNQLSTSASGVQEKLTPILSFISVLEEPHLYSTSEDSSVFLLCFLSALLYTFQSGARSEWDAAGYQTVWRKVNVKQHCRNPLNERMNVLLNASNFSKQVIKKHSHKLILVMLCYMMIIWYCWISIVRLIIQ